MTTRRALAVAALVASLALAGCAAQPTPSASPASPSPTPTPTPTFDPLEGMTLQQRVGQLFMVGTPAAAAGPEALSAVTDRHVGSIFLSGRSSAGVDATAAVVAQFTSIAERPLFVATDQEGGQVQVLSGPGFSGMPSGLDQGALAPGDLRAAAATWGAELAAAGVNVNLAPVADVTSGPDSDNQPIARYDREYGFDPATVQDHAQAFIDGMRSAGVTSTVKHFPGLGLVRGNTDDTAGVTDDAVSRTGIQVFPGLIADGAPVVMVSSAIYSLIDGSAPAVFSPTVVTDVLRGDLGFKGLVMTDDLSGATQVQGWSPADRAILSLQAGVDIVLVSRTPAVAAEMIDAVVAKAQAEPAFAALVDTAARRVIDEKAALGLITPLVTSAGVDPDNTDDLTASGVVSGIAESGGTCRFTFHAANGAASRLTTKGTRVGDHTECGPVHEATSLVGTGTFPTTLRYETLDGASYEGPPYEMTIR